VAAEDDGSDVATIEHVTFVPFTKLSLFILMGRGVERVDSVPAGNVCAIAGLDNVVINTATLCTLRPAPPFRQMRFQVSDVFLLFCLSCFCFMSINSLLIYTVIFTQPTYQALLIVCGAVCPVALAHIIE
jgi:hypothetical protein